MSHKTNKNFIKIKLTESSVWLHTILFQNSESFSPGWYKTEYWWEEKTECVNGPWNDLCFFIIDQWHGYICTLLVRWKSLPHWRFNMIITFNSWYPGLVSWLSKDSNILLSVWSRVENPSTLLKLGSGAQLWSQHVGSGEGEGREGARPWNH